MWPRLVIVPDERAERVPQVPFVHDDDVVQALPPKCAHQPLRDAVGLRRGDRREHRVDADALRPLDEVAAVGAVSVTDQETRAVSPRRGIDELPPDPGRRRMCGDVDVHHRAAIVRDEEEDVERVEPERVHP